MQQIKFLNYLLIFYLMPFIVVSQKTSKFRLVVSYQTSSNDTLQVGESYFLRQYRSANFFKDSFRVDNSQYFFAGELLYPTAIRLFTLSNKTELNKLIFIDSGYQRINLNSYYSMGLLCESQSTKIEREHLEFLKQMEVSDMEKKMSEMRLEQYVKKHPASYVALFALIHQTFNFNLSPGLKRIAFLFDSSIQLTKGYKYFAEEYILEKKIPEVKLKNERGEDVQMNFEQPDGRYTLIEFWFTGCSACIPAKLYLKKFYRDLSTKAQIISVCTDKNVSPKAKKILNQLGLPWKNYWDYDAAQFSDYINIYIYPSNLLLNEKGYTVGKDIDPTKMLNFILSDKKNRKIK